MLCVVCCMFYVVCCVVCMYLNSAVDLCLCNMMQCKNDMLLTWTFSTCTSVAVAWGAWLYVTL
ncbi:hypothetical protein B0T26DRAFT_682407 [Lasiosphaeria miniovina]|uniref:Uncharacterized protein n=1 Tax=Lasiosphaeria miniovina TaxID=1954250 RepID=A0AA40BEU1_9PEZI|nr:uncharacterized protein B0T26DRAFT_682407 [Lasiosphaeria miniovina]KAK0732946.1 hypothetical protein B0T26DRAFT_682407 [Lasiosphaeria miniovina]